MSNKTARRSPSNVQDYDKDDKVLQVPFHAQLFAVDGTNILLFAVELIIKHQRDFTSVAEYPRVCVEKYTS